MAKALRIRFFEKVAAADENGCRRWLGAFVTRGYGAFWLEGRQQLAHRVAFFLEHGHWPEPLCLHSCDNRWCCEQAHLSQGTNEQNMQEMSARGRANPSRGELNGRAKLDAETVRQIRASGKSTRELAREIGVSQSTVWLARSGKKWAHVVT
jgi:hypothetical protein